MVRLALAVIATIAIVAFVISNSHHVDLSLAVGKPVEIRLIFLLLCAFIIGMIVPVFFRLVHRLDSEKQLRRESELRRAAEGLDQDVVG